MKGIVSSMSAYEDEVVRYYACKTVENITAQSVSAGHLFASANTCKLLIDIFLHGRKESFRNTGAIALSHICKLNATLFNYVIDYIPFDEMCTVLMEGNSRVQQAFITMINLALLHKNEKLLTKMGEYRKHIKQAIISLFEHTSLVIRGKSIISVVLMIRNEPLKWFTVFTSDNKFFNIIDKLTKDSYKYVQYGLMHFIDEINQVIPLVMDKIRLDLIAKISSD